MFPLSKEFEQKYDVAWELATSGDKTKVGKGFALFKSLALDSSYSHSERARAYVGMGQIVEIFNIDLAPGDDESGLIYYQHALLLDPNNLDALEGIVHNFRESPASHQDIESFEFAYNKLINNTEYLDCVARDAHERKMLKKRSAILRRLKKKRQRKTLAVTAPEVRTALATGQWEEKGLIRSKVSSSIIGTKVTLVQQVGRCKVWVTGCKTATGKLHISNAGTL